MVSEGVDEMVDVMLLVLLIVLLFASMKASEAIESVRSASCSVLIDASGIAYV